MNDASKRDPPSGAVDGLVDLGLAGDGRRGSRTQGTRRHDRGQRRDHPEEQRDPQARIVERDQDEHQHDLDQSRADLDAQPSPGVLDPTGQAAQPGPQRSTVRAMTEVIAVRVENGEVVLDLRDRKTN